MKKRIFFPVILLIILLSVPFVARAGFPEDIPAGKNEIHTQLYAWDKATLPEMTWEDGEYKGKAARFINISNMSALGVTSAAEHAYLWDGEYYSYRPETAADSLKQEDSLLLIYPLTGDDTGYVLFVAEDQNPDIDLVSVAFKKDESGPVGLDNVGLTYTGDRYLAIQKDRYTVSYPLDSQQDRYRKHTVQADYTLDGQLIRAEYNDAAYDDENIILSEGFTYVFEWEQISLTEKKIAITGYFDYANGLNMSYGDWYNTETWEEIPAPEGFDPNFLPCEFIGGTTVTMETAQPEDSSWNLPVPQERAVYASVPGFTTLPPAPFVSKEATESGNRYTIDGLAAWGVTAVAIPGQYFPAESGPDLVAVGDGKWAVELPEDYNGGSYETTAEDGMKISIMLDTSDDSAYISIEMSTVSYSVADNEEVQMTWQPSGTEYITAFYSRATGELTKYEVYLDQGEEYIYYAYEPGDLGGLELKNIEHSFPDSSAESGRRSYFYSKTSGRWYRIDSDTYEIQENAEVPEEVLSRCVELPLI